MRRRRAAEVARRSHQIRPESCRKRQKVGGNKGPGRRRAGVSLRNGFLIYEQFFAAKVSAPTCQQWDARDELNHFQRSLLFLVK
jgi:hypothetical protein